MENCLHLQDTAFSPNRPRLQPPSKLLGRARGMDQMLTADCWACVLHALHAAKASLCELLRASAACRTSRLAISLVREIWLNTTSECDARMLARFMSVHLVRVSCFDRDATLEETMRANPGTEQHPTRPNCLQYVGTLAPDTLHPVWHGGGVPAGPSDKVADQDMCRRLPYALCALPRLECVNVDSTIGVDLDSTPQQQHAFKEFLLAICAARCAGQLRSLRYIEHDCLDCERTASRHVFNGMLYKRIGEECLCADLLSGMPLENLIQYIEAHGLCADKADIVRSMVQRGEPLGELIQSSRASGIFCPSECGSYDVREEGVSSTIQVLNTSPHVPTYFDCCFCALVNSVACDPAIVILVEAGYRPSPALHEAAASGRLEKFMIIANIDDGEEDAPSEEVVEVRAKAAVAWVLGKRVDRLGVGVPTWALGE